MSTKDFYKNPDYIQKQRLSHLGDKNPNWQGSISKIKHMTREEYISSGKLKENGIKGRFQKGYIPWNKGKLYDMLKRNGYSYKKGHKNPNKGKTFEEAFGIEIAKKMKEAISRSMKNRKGVMRVSILKRCLGCERDFYWRKSGGRQTFCSKLCYMNYGKKHPEIYHSYKNGNSFHKKECPFCHKIFIGHISRKFCSRTCSAKNRGLGGMKQYTTYMPNNCEKSLENMIIDLKLPYKFVGNGKVIIGGINPDFINVNGQKKVIELFGDYWHTKKDVKWHQTEIGRKAIYSRYGFSVLIIWEKELKTLESLKHKLEEFEYGDFIIEKG